MEKGQVKFKNLSVPINIHELMFEQGKCLISNISIDSI